MAREEKKTAILEAAGKVFYSKGYEGTRMDDIAKEAGIGKGTVYEYFKSKQQLFEEMVIYNYKRYLDGVVNAISSGTDFKEQFIALAKYQSRLVKEHMAAFEKIAYSRSMNREMGALLVEHDVKINEIIKDMVVQAIQRGELSAETDSDISVAMINGAIIHYCCKNVLFNKIDPEEIDYEKLWKILLKGISNS